MKGTSHKSLAKNSLFLYFRMLFNMGITLYTSRVVLETLGIEDFGIYSIVGGIVSMFSFLNTSLSSATSRFFSIEIGVDNVENIKKVYNSSVLLHFCIAILLFIIAETIGLWFLYDKLVIPDDRFHAAVVVYQFSILASIFAIIRIPYTALIISYERMKAYAYIGIIESVAKLIIVFVLTYFIFIDKLILYGILIFLITLVITSFYIFFCHKHFKFISLSTSYLNKKITLSMLHFSSLDLYGNMSIVIRNQGVNILQNLFFGPLINAATAVANQVQTAVASFSDSFLMATKPRILKNYGNDKIKDMISLIYLSSKFSFFLLLFLILPLAIENKFVLSLWLKNTPDFTTIFCQINLISMLFSVIFIPIIYSIHATGKMKRISFINGTIYILSLPISYLFLKLGYSPITPFIVNFILHLICSFSNVYTLHLYIPSFSQLDFYKHVFFKCFIIFILSSIIPLFLHYYMDYSWLRFVLVLLSSIILTFCTVYFIGIDHYQKTYLLDLIKKKKYK